MEEHSVAIAIPASLYKKIEERIKGSDFKSVSDYIAKVAEESLAREAKEEPGLSQEEEEKVKERLKALGYLD